MGSTKSIHALDGFGKITMKYDSMASLTLMLAVALLGCSEEDDIKIVQAGQNLSGSSFFKYSNPDGDNDCDGDCDSTTDVCNVVNGTHSLVLMRASDYILSEYDSDCVSNSAFSKTFKFKAEVLGVAAGASLPEMITMSTPKIGFDTEKCLESSVFLASVRLVNGRPWAGFCLPVEPTNLEPEPLNSSRRIQLPSSFEELSRQSIEAMADFENVCADERPGDFEITDNIFARLEECPPPAPFVPNNDPPEDDEGEESPND